MTTSAAVASDALASLFTDRAAERPRDDPGQYCAYWFVVAGRGRGESA
jgi:hypothetical protein